MGTYTTNYQLYMPSIGEQGWGELVNGNFITIDSAMDGLNTRMETAESNITSLTTRMGTAEPIITSNTSRIGTLEIEADAVEERVTANEERIATLETGEFEHITSENIVGSLLIDVSSTNSNTFGTYSLTETTGSKALTSVSSTNTSGVTGASIVVPEFDFAMKKGFRTESKTFLINATASCSPSRLSAWKLYIYCNDTLVGSAIYDKSGWGSGGWGGSVTANNFTASVGDVISAKVVLIGNINSGVVGSGSCNVNTSITISGSGDVYLA